MENNGAYYDFFLSDQRTSHETAWAKNVNKMVIAKIFCHKNVLLDTVPFLPEQLQAWTKYI